MNEYNLFLDGEWPRELNDMAAKQPDDRLFGILQEIFGQNRSNSGQFYYATALRISRGGQEQPGQWDAVAHILVGRPEAPRPARLHFQFLPGAATEDIIDELHDRVQKAASGDGDYAGFCEHYAIAALDIEPSSAAKQYFVEKRVGYITIGGGILIDIPGFYYSVIRESPRLFRAYDSMDEMRASDAAQQVLRAMLSMEQEEMTVSRLAGRSSASSTTVYRVRDCMMSLGLVTQVPGRGKRFRLTESGVEEIRVQLGLTSRRSKTAPKIYTKLIRPRDSEGGESQ